MPRSRPGAGAGFRIPSAPVARAPRSASRTDGRGISELTRRTSPRARRNEARAFRTSAGSRAALAPEATEMRFSPASSTRTSATPVGWPRTVRSAATSTPSCSSAVRAALPKSSSPTAPTNAVRTPSRDAATAWLPPFPPWCRSNVPPITVSPGAGSRGARTTRSTLTEPTTITRPLIGNTASVRGANRAIR